jgi:hypothetical protein
MTQDWAIAILGLLLTGIFGYAFRIDQSASDKCAKLFDKLDVVRDDIGNVRIEVTKLDGKIGGILLRDSVIAAHAAHSPDDHHGLDRHFEEYNRLYVEHHGDIGSDNWIKYRDIFAKAMLEHGGDALVKVACESIVLACEHKMEGYGLLNAYPRPI